MFSTLVSLKLIMCPFSNSAVAAEMDHLLIASEESKGEEPFARG
jgi:hypothetical protein